MAEAKKITQDELSSHINDNDLWMAIHGKVYDVSLFKKHPGGFEILKEHGGKDASKPFDDIGHSEKALKDLEDFYIGEYMPNDKPAETQTTKTPSILLASFIVIVVGFVISYYIL
jgi:cytochrome b5